MLRGDGIPSAPSLAMQELLRQATDITTLHPVGQPYSNPYLILDLSRAVFLKKVQLDSPQQSQWHQCLARSCVSLLLQSLDY